MQLQTESMDSGIMLCFFFMDCVPNTSKTEAQTKLALKSLLILL